MTTGPLAGLKVLDASAGAVGPWAGCLLGQLGADVVKLESPQGDFIRNVMPPKRGLSTTYICMNFSKRAVTLDLKDAGERATAHRLAAKADVFLENFRPGVVERLGLGYEALAAINPRLIYASASGFGWSGPLVEMGATDPHIQAFTGSTSVNGEPGGLRQRMRWYGHFDVNTSACIVQAVLTALYLRDKTGLGRRVEITMAEAAMALQRVRISEHLAGGRPAPMGSATTYLVPDQAFATQDDYILVSATSRRQWRQLCATLDLSDLAADPRFASNPKRVENRAVLVAILAEAFRRRPTWFWLQRLGQAGVPSARVHSFEELPDNTHMRANGMLVTFATPQWGALTVAGEPWSFSRTPARLWSGSLPGEDTKAVIEGDWPGVVLEDQERKAPRIPHAPVVDPGGKA